MILHVQGLRGLAILSVLLFHLWPQYFPNGYIGVDIFFVLSGFLMAMIFSRYEKLTFKCFWDFYYKRVKRIFPLYYLMIPMIFLCGQVFLNHVWVPLNNEHFYYAMVLLKNMETIWNGADYFATFQTAAPSKDLFLHTWSLAVEILFYIVVPFIFLALSLFPRPNYKIAILGGISSISCVLYYYSNPIFSFNYPLSRLWKIGAGMISFFVNAKSGDAKITNQIDKGLIVIFSLIIYHFYENYYRTLSLPKIVLLLGFLIAFNSVTYYTFRRISAVTDFFDNYRLMDPITRKIVDQNYEFANAKIEDIVKGRYNKTLSATVRQFWYPFGVWDYEKGHGSSRILVVGNSYAIYQANTIKEEFKGNYSSFRLIAGLSLQVLYDLFANSPSDFYFGQHESALKMIEDYSPDYIFITTRFQDPQKQKIEAEVISDDPLMKEYDQTLVRLENSNVSKIFIQGSTPLYPMIYLNKFIGAVIDNSDLKELPLDKKKEDIEMEDGERRVDNIKCSKCQKIDTRSAFLEEDRYLGFDSKTLLSFINSFAKGFESREKGYRGRARNMKTT